MSRWVFWLLLAATPVYAANQEVAIQPDETFPWWCEFFAEMDHVVDTDVTVLKGGPDASPDSLVTGMQIDSNDTSRALWNFTPSGRPNRTTYHVHILAEDAFGSRFACDGSVRVEKVIPK